MHRSIVVLTSMFLEQSGFESKPRPYLTRISEETDAIGTPDVVGGLPGTHVRVSSRGSFRIGGDLDNARRAAAIAGRGDLGLLVQMRRGDARIDEAFAVMTLRDLTALLGGRPPTS